MKGIIKNINMLNFGWNSNKNSRFWNKNVVLNLKLNFLNLFQHKFLSFIQLPSSCKVSDQTDKMPGNESKNKIGPEN